MDGSVDGPFTVLNREMMSSMRGPNWKMDPEVQTSIQVSSTRMHLASSLLCVSALSAVHSD
jgi:hypothetical protein